MLPRTLIGFSSKSYFSLRTAREWLDQVAGALASDPLGGQGCYACVPHPLLSEFGDRLRPIGMEVGLQDVSAHPPGPFTGEVHAQLVGDLGARYVMVGHPERRRLFGEDGTTVRAKVEAAVGAGMVPILVCGEQNRGQDPAPVLREQISRAFGDLPAGAEVVAAYEPTWAIGQDQAAPAAHVADTVAALRGVLAEVVGQSRIVYGGSATPGTFTSIVEAAGVREAAPDGVFLGRGGLDPDGFLTAVREVRAGHNLS